MGSLLRHGHRVWLKVVFVVVACFAAGLVTAGVVSGAGPLAALSMSTGHGATETETTDTTTTETTGDRADRARANGIDSDGYDRDGDDRDTEPTETTETRRSPSLRPTLGRRRSSPTRRTTCPRGVRRADRQRLGAGRDRPRLRQRRRGPSLEPHGDLRPTDLGASSTGSSFRDGSSRPTPSRRLATPLVSRGMNISDSIAQGDPRPRTNSNSGSGSNGPEADIENSGDPGERSCRIAQVVASTRISGPQDRSVRQPVGRRSQKKGADTIEDSPACLRETSRPSARRPSRALRQRNGSSGRRLSGWGVEASWGRPRARLGRRCRLHRCRHVEPHSGGKHRPGQRGKHQATPPPAPGGRRR